MAQLKPVEPSKFEGGCPCGRSHPSTGKTARSRKQPRDTAELTAALYEQGRSIADADETGRVPLHYAGNCQSPISMKVNDTTRLFAAQKVRCRRCPACLKARQFHWGRRGQAETAATTQKGLRSWFGTLTLRPEALADLTQRAFEAWAAGQPTGDHPEWWSDPKCDERFRLVRTELYGELRRYFARLRKAGHRFSYLVVFERHKSGEPHLHFLLHEKVAPIRKREIQSEWRLGFSQCSIVGGRSKRSAAPEAAAWYVVKYLSKSFQSRQLASLKYGKESTLSG